MENNIGNARRAYAERLGIRFTQEDAARYFGVSKGTYSAWEQGVGKGLKGEQLCRIADKYGVTTDYLLCITDKKPRYTYRILGLNPDKGYSELVDIYNGLSESGRGQLLDYARFLEGKEKR